MTRLAEILDQMSAVLNDLKTVMDQEQQHLSMGQINGSQLQWITEQKSSLLATLDYLEQLRRKEPNTANSVDIREGANKQVISSQADSLIKISRIWADFFPANTSNQPI